MKQQTLLFQSFGYQNEHQYINWLQSIIFCNHLYMEIRTLKSITPSSNSWIYPHIKLFKVHDIHIEVQQPTMRPWEGSHDPLDKYIYKAWKSNPNLLSLHNTSKWNLCPFSMNTPSKLNVLGHNGHPLGMNSTLS